MDDIAILRLPLKDSMPAHALVEIISIVDEIYISNVWLNKADQFEGMMPDDYQVEVDDWLDIYRLEIGTPNFIEFIGQAESLLPAATFIAVSIGLPKVILEIVKLPFDIIKLNLDSKKLKLEVEKHEKDKNASNVRREEVEVAVKDAPIGFSKKTEKLMKEGKVSKVVYNYKQEREDALADKSQVYMPVYLRTDENPKTIIYVSDIS